MKKSTKIAKVRAPNGYEFRIKENKVYSRFQDSGYKFIQVNLFSKRRGKTIGHVNLVRYSKNEAFNTHSNLEERYRGKGYGSLMYAKAIQWCLEHDYKVSSSGASSQDAQRVWKGKTLRKFFKIKVKRYQTYPDYDKWYAYAK